MYKVVELKSGRKMFYKDGKLVSRKSIPEEALAGLETAPVVETHDEATTAPEPEAIAEVMERKCIFCGQPGTDPKRINSEDIALCLEHYQTKTTGQVVQKIREMNKELVNG